MKTAIVYDRVNKWGGAERVLLALHQLFPKAPLYTSLFHDKRASWAKVFPNVVPSFLNRLPFLRSRHELVPFLMPIVFENFDFSEYDLVISVTSEAAKGIRTSGKTKHVCYCLTPTRYLWHAEELMIGKSFKSKLIKPIINYLKDWDKKAAKRPDLFIAISNTVKERIKRYYKRDSLVVYPPVDLSIFKNVRNTKKSDSYLIVSRLVKHKMVELAVDCFNNLPYKLTIVGTGKDEEFLKSKAKRNIKFLGQVSDKKLLIEYQKARALIFPQEEDFGLVALEAQAVGVPVIAFGKGGARETVIEGKTGIFFNKQTVESLSVAIEKFEKMSFDKNVLFKNAKRFSIGRFKKEFRKTITQLL